MFVQRKQINGEYSGIKKGSVPLISVARVGRTAMGKGGEEGSLGTAHREKPYFSKSSLKANAFRELCQRGIG